MENKKEYVLAFLPTALQDMTEIISTFIMLGSPQGAIRIKDKINKESIQSPYLHIFLIIKGLFSYPLHNTNNSKI